MSALGLVDGRLVVLAGAELEQLLGVVDLPPQLLVVLHEQLQARALAGDGLRLLGVVPETRGEGGVSEPVDLALQCRQVKDAPLAP